MDRFCGIESLPIVYHRFSDGVEVVKCVLEFYKEMADVERSYSSSIHRLLRSSSYTFHSNILMQWLGSEPFEEIGTLKHSWQKLGAELCILGDLHAEKATAYSDAIRKPLMDLLPELEEARKTLRNKLYRLRDTLEAAQRKHTREKQKYQLLGDNYEKLFQRMTEMKSTATEKPSTKLRRLETKLTSLNTDLQNQEAIYKTAYNELLSALETFNKEVAEEYQKLEVRELERVNTLKQSLQGFARTLSNTAPAYLESMQQIVLSVDEIDGSSDIKCFVETHSDLMTPPPPPNFEKYTVGIGQESSDNAAAAVSNKSDCTEHEENPTEHPEAANESGEEISTVVDSEIEQKSESLDEDGQLPQPGPTTRSATTQEQKQDSGTQSLAGKQPKQAKKLPGSAAKARPKENVIGTPSPVASVVQGMETKSQECAEKVNAKQKTTAQSISTVRPLLAPKPRLNVTCTGGSKVKHSSPPPAESKQAAKGTVGFTSAASATASQQNHPRTRTSSMESRDSKEVKERTATLNSLSSQFRPKGHSFHGSASNARVLSTPQSKKRTLTNADAERWTRKDKEALADGTNPEVFEMLCQLQQQATANDYYTLLGVEAGASTDEMARARRERSKDLHPDHFGSDPDKRASAEEQLVLINQIFQDIFKNEDARSLYDQLCTFRKVYPKTLQQKQKGLETAEGKLLGLYKRMKKAQMPLPLLDELQLALGLIKMCLQKL